MKNYFGETHKYDDIINLPHHVSGTHPQMPVEDRAAQFAPFAALTGYGAAIKETERYTEKRIQPDEESVEILNRRLEFIREHISEKPEVTVTYNGEKHDSIYDESKLETKDKYAVLFGGNYGEVTIETEAKNGKCLMILKDSFANSMVPYLLEDYEKIVMIDLRYYRGSLSQDIEEQKVTDLLVLYEMSNFAQDRNLYKLNTFD